MASAEVKETLTGKAFTLAYLQEGEYELHFAAYSKNSDSGRVSFEAMLKSENNVNGSVADIITVQGSATITISSSIKGTL